jgi:crotonobetainyl-CoA:carnitine CoA-transferase CaiB-like acyl-CoA transferase
MGKMEGSSRLPLAGVKCVCCIMFQQVPAAFTMMADLGAEVIKIEPPGVGEQGRGFQKYPGMYLSSYFETNNRGFKSVTLNLKTKKGLEILYQLAKDADIFAENFRPGVAARNHFAYEDIVKINPGVVYLRVLLMGRTDRILRCRAPMPWRRPLAAWPAHSAIKERR